MSRQLFSASQKRRNDDESYGMEPSTSRRKLGSPKTTMLDDEPEPEYEFDESDQSDIEYEETQLEEESDYENGDDYFLDAGKLEACKEAAYNPGWTSEKPKNIPAQVKYDGVFGPKTQYNTEVEAFMSLITPEMIQIIVIDLLITNATERANHQLSNDIRDFLSTFDPDAMMHDDNNENNDALSSFETRSPMEQAPMNSPEAALPLYAEPPVYLELGEADGTESVHVTNPNPGADVVLHDGCLPSARPQIYTWDYIQLLHYQFLPTVPFEVMINVVGIVFKAGIGPELNEILKSPSKYEIVLVKQACLERYLSKYFRYFQDQLLVRDPENQTVLYIQTWRYFIHVFDDKKLEKFEQYAIPLWNEALADYWPESIRNFLQGGDMDPLMHSELRLLSEIDSFSKWHCSFLDWPMHHVAPGGGESRTLTEDESAVVAALAPKRQRMPSESKFEDIPSTSKASATAIAPVIPAKRPKLVEMATVSPLPSLWYVDLSRSPVRSMEVGLNVLWKYLIPIAKHLDYDPKIYFKVINSERSNSNLFFWINDKSSGVTFSNIWNVNHNWDPSTAKDLNKIVVHFECAACKQRTINCSLRMTIFLKEAHVIIDTNEEVCVEHVEKIAEPGVKKRGRPRKNPKPEPVDLSPRNCGDRYPPEDAQAVKLKLKSKEFPEDFVSIVYAECIATICERITEGDITVFHDSYNDLLEYCQLTLITLRNDCNDYFTQSVIDGFARRIQPLIDHQHSKVTQRWDLAGVREKQSFRRRVCELKDNAYWTSLFYDLIVDLSSTPAEIAFEICHENSFDYEKATSLETNEEKESYLDTLKAIYDLPQQIQWTDIEGVIGKYKDKKDDVKKGKENSYIFDIPTWYKNLLKVDKKPTVRSTLNQLLHKRYLCRNQLDGDGQIRGQDTRGSPDVPSSSRYPTQ